MIDDADQWEVSIRHNPRARKLHVCCECGRTIERGEQHLVVKALYEKKWSTYRTCVHCEAVSGWLYATCGGYLSEGILEDLGEHWSENELRHYWLGRYILSMERKWRTSAGELMPVPELHLPPQYLAAEAPR